MIVGVLRNSLRSLARRPGKPAVFLIIIAYVLKHFHPKMAKNKKSGPRPSLRPRPREKAGNAVHFRSVF